MKLRIIDFSTQSAFEGSIDALLQTFSTRDQSFSPLLTTFNVRLVSWGSASRDDLDRPSARTVVPNRRRGDHGVWSFGSREYTEFSSPWTSISDSFCSIGLLGRPNKGEDGVAGHGEKTLPVVVVLRSNPGVLGVVGVSHLGAWFCGAASEGLGTEVSIRSRSPREVCDIEETWSAMFEVGTGVRRWIKLVEGAMEHIHLSAHGVRV